jgi:thiamine-phosphate pyrophosphorylase
VSRRAGWQPAALARAFLQGGARCLQLRAKSLPSNQFLDLCDTIVGLARAHDAVVIVNDRPDLALMSGAAGVHVGQEDLPPSAARGLMGRTALVGFSTHTSDHIGQALAEPISYIAIGPVFGTTTKETGYGAVGLGMVTEAARRSKSLPVVAIGGITLANAISVWQAGASGVAVISDLLEGGDPAAQVAAYLEAAASVGRI